MYKIIPYDKHYINQYEVNATLENILDMMLYYYKKEDHFKVQMYQNILYNYLNNLKAFRLYAYSFIVGYNIAIDFLEKNVKPLIKKLQEVIEDEKKELKELIYNE